MKVVFIDRDGTIIVEPPDEQIDSLEKLELIPHAIEGLRLFCDRGFQLVMVTNQDGLGTDRYPLASFEAPQNKLLRILQGEGITISQVFVCPHVPADQCNCRKPKTGLLDQYLKELQPDLSRSFVFGDRETDVQLGKNIGCKTIRLSSDSQSAADFITPDFLKACQFIVRSERAAHIERNTAETSISVDVVLDGSGTYSLNTGVGFFDHMLAQLSKHSLMDLTVTARGDLHVDEHHTVEDTGLAIGSAIRQALGDKQGIERYGFLLPMDESSAQVALDLSDRPYFVFNGTFEREKVGEFPTELAEDFFRALADGLRANLHISVQGRNDHHKIEAMFKSVARTLKQAVAVDQRSPATLPSTKGTL
jgi:imidazoleglycerol-phosphate dehydratase/histidinol-phosphatase